MTTYSQRTDGRNIAAEFFLDFDTLLISEGNSFFNFWLYAGSEFIEIKWA